MAAWIPNLSSKGSPIALEAGAVEGAGAVCGN